MSILLFFFRTLFRGSADRFDFHACEFAPMSDLSVITFAPFVFERDNLFVLTLLDYFGSDLCPAPRDFAGIDVRERFKRGNLTRLDIEKIDIDGLALRDAVLPATRFDNCVSHKFEIPEEEKRRKVPQLCGFGKRIIKEGRFPDRQYF
jgi:hypothetical protein